VDQGTQGNEGIEVKRGNAEVGGELMRRISIFASTPG